VTCSAIFSAIQSSIRASTLVFHRGPLFSQMVLIDEVNRATAKTQSALLEAMEEHRISIDA